MIDPVVMPHPRPCCSAIPLIGKLRIHSGIFSPSRADSRIEQVYLHRAPVDMRKQIDGLVILAKEVIQQDPTSGALFVFINLRRNKLKLLIWERNGFVKPSTKDPRK
jgi:transposase